MPTIAEVRQKYPQYDDMSDAQLAGALHQKYYSDMPVEEFNQKIGLPPATAASDDHGLARRQQMSVAEKAVSPITEYPRNYQEMRTEAQQQIGRGLSQLGEGAFGSGLAGDVGKFAAGVGNVGLGALGFIGSPISAAYRSVLGQPVEDITGIPREQTEFAAQLATPGIGFTKLARAPGVAEPAPLIKPPMEKPPGVEVGEAAQRLREANLPGDVPRAITGGPTTQALGQYTSNVPLAGQPIAEAVRTTLPKQLEQARNIVAAEHGEGAGENVANRIGATLQEQAAAETKARTDQAAQADAQATAEWQRAQAEREAAVAAQEQQSTQAAQAAVGPDVAPLDMGETVIGQVRAAHDAARDAKDTAYRAAGQHQGTIFDDAVGNVERHVNADLRSDRGGQGIVTTTANLTPAAMDMRASLRAFSERARQRAAQAQEEAIAGGGTADDAAQTGINLRTLETQRQELGNLAQGAKTDADRRAARRIMGAFDDWHEAAMENHFDGDPGALGAYRNARALNRDFRTRYGYNSRDDADKLINKIVRGEEDQHTGPVGVSDALTARNDKSGPLFARVTEATNDHPDVRQAIRSGTWNKLSRDVPGAKEPTTLAGAVAEAQRARANIYDHILGKGRDVAGRVFTQQERDLMRAHADTLVDAARRRVASAAETKAATPVPTKVEPGPIQQLVDQVIGGKASDEALFKTLHNYARTGGDVKALARVIGQIPQSMRGDLAASFIRKLGVSPTTKQFSLDHFVNHWNDITPQAKSVMFGNAGPHVTALNDIATIAQRLKEVKGKFGNPSGTAQNSLFGLIAGAIGQSAVGTAKTLTLAGAGYLGAKVLASPAGASSVAKYARAVERANRTPSIENITAMKLMQRNLQNTARSLAAISNK